MSRADLLDAFAVTMAVVFALLAVSQGLGAVL